VLKSYAPAIGEKEHDVIDGRVDAISRDPISGWCTDYDDPYRVIELSVCSTYLQMAFYESREALSVRGMLYPDTEFGWVGRGSSSHTEYHCRLSDLDTTELPSHFNSLNSSEHKTVLISSEDLVGVSRQSLRYLCSPL
jgi:hypothetical protein